MLKRIADDRDNVCLGAENEKKTIHLKMFTALQKRFQHV